MQKQIRSPTYFDSEVKRVGLYNFYFIQVVFQSVSHVCLL